MDKLKEKIAEAQKDMPLKWSKKEEKEEEEKKEDKSLPL